jgi:long-subunit acyl-CoA synthetase (AMP-forming)
MTHSPYGPDVDSTTQPHDGMFTFTEAVLSGADRRGDRPALVDLGGGAFLSYRTLVTTVAGVAAGLVRRGTRPGQLCGVYADTVAGHFVAVHAALAAGALAAPISATAPADEVARRLCRTDARLLFTTRGLAPKAVAAADRSRVRQVLCFGPARDTTDVADLLSLEPIPLQRRSSGGPTALVTAHGPVTHQGVLARMAELDAGVRVGESDVVLAAWPLDGGCDLVALVGLALARGAIVVAAPDTHDLPGTIHDFGVTVAATAGRTPGLWRP